MKLSTLSNEELISTSTNLALLSKSLEKAGVPNELRLVWNSLFTEMNLRGLDNISAQQLRNAYELKQD